MDERNTQNFDLDKRLALLEKWIRNGIQIDIPYAVKDSVDRYEVMTSKERELFLDRTVILAHSHTEYFSSQLSWAVLKGLSERILERDEMPPKALARFAMEVLTGRIREKRERGRPPRSVVQEQSIVEAYDTMINYGDYTVGEAREKIAKWMSTKPSTVAKIIRDQGPSWPRPFSKK